MSGKNQLQKSREWTPKEVGLQ